MIIYSLFNLCTLNPTNTNFHLLLNNVNELYL